MPRMLATRIAAHAVLKSKSAAEFLIWIPSASGSRRSTLRRSHRSSRVRSPPSRPRRRTAARSARAASRRSRSRRPRRTASARATSAARSSARAACSPSPGRSRGRRRPPSSRSGERVEPGVEDRRERDDRHRVRRDRDRHQRAAERREAADDDREHDRRARADQEAAERLLERVPAGAPQRAALVVERRTMSVGFGSRNCSMSNAAIAPCQSAIPSTKTNDRREPVAERRPTRREPAAASDVADDSHSHAPPPAAGARRAPRSISRTSVTSSK